MPSYLHPGVYVEEVPSGVRSIEGAPTSTTIFVGETERGPTEPTFITNVGQYEDLFGGFLRPDTGPDPVRVTLRYAIDAYFRNGGSKAHILRALPSSATTGSRSVTINSGGTIVATALLAASPGVWSAGGELRAVILDPRDATSSATRFRIAVFHLNCHTAEMQLVEDWDGLSVDPADPEGRDVVDVLRRSFYVRWSENPLVTAAMTTRPDSDYALGGLNPPTLRKMSQADIAAAGGALAGGTGGDASFAAATLPGLLSALDGIDDAALMVGAPDIWVQAAAPADADVRNYYDALRVYVDNRPEQDLFLIGDIPRQQDATSATAAASAARTFVGTAPFNRSTFAAVYFPHVVALDPVGTGANPEIRLPPSGFVAGLYGRTDSRRGVWKAPAGVEVTVGGATALEWNLLDADQDLLNLQGVNVLRGIPGAGTVVWGARTLEPGGEWRYVPVRRTAIFLRKSIFNGIQWAVFESDDEPLWQCLRLTIGNFMEAQFRNGAFAGRTSKEAYYVKVDAETTTEADQAAGIVNILVGFAPLRPAEFVIVKLSQKTRDES